jgi:beta-glucosidase
MLRDAGGQNKPGTVKVASSPRDGVRVRPIDDLAQESGQQFAFSGSGLADAYIEGVPIDLSRQANGELAISFRYRVDAAPHGDVGLMFGRGRTDVTDLFQGAPLNEWRTMKVRLSCLGGEGVDLNGIDVPFGLSTASAFTVSISEIRLAPNNNDAVCPAEPGR